jgi:hypothetical protein
MMQQVVFIGTALLALLQSSLLGAQAVGPASEFLDGSRATFTTEGHPKAKSVNFKISYPNSWAAAEGERPNIVQKFVSEGGNGLEMAMIITKELPIPAGMVVTKEDMRELFAASGLSEMLPAGAEFIDSQSTEIEATPAGILEYRMNGDRAGISLMIHAWTLNFIYEKILVQVQFQVGGPAGGRKEVNQRMAEFKPLFTLMANSIVFPDKWTDTPKGAQTPTLTIVIIFAAAMVGVGLVAHFYFRSSSRMGAAHDGLDEG